MWLILTGNLRPTRHGLSYTSFTHVAASPTAAGAPRKKLRKPDDGGEQAGTSAAEAWREQYCIGSSP